MYKDFILHLGFVVIFCMNCVYAFVREYVRGCTFLKVVFNIHKQGCARLTLNSNEFQQK